MSATRADIVSGVHHVRRYHDAEASAHAVLLDARAGALVAASTARGHASLRTRYASAGDALDLAVDRLARRLVVDLLGPRPGPSVTLIHRPHSALERGIALAEAGDWFGAIEAWDAMRSELLSDPARARTRNVRLLDACEHNLRVGHAVVGLPPRRCAPRSPGDRRT